MYTPIIYKTYNYDENQKPNLSKIISFDTFKKSFLKTTATLFKDSKYAYELVDQITNHINNELTNNAKINSRTVAEKFLHEIPQGKTTYHDGYMEYLLTAWKCDCGIEVGPWHIWNIILHQLCKLINSDPDTYRHIFTTSNEKIKVNLYGEFNIHDFINKLKEFLPTNVNKFVPQFENQPPNYLECMYGLFAEMVKEYYSGAVMSCSIPRVRILGNKEDWVRILDLANSLAEIIPEEGDKKNKYFPRICKTLQDMVDNLDNAEYWTKFFHIDLCGSGSQQFIYGHVTHFFLDTFIDMTMVPRMLSRFPFTEDNLLNKNGDPLTMNFVSGIMFSSLDNEGYLVPEFHHNITMEDSDVFILDDKDKENRLVMLKFIERMKKYSGLYQTMHYPITRHDLQDKSSIHKQCSTWNVTNRSIENKNVKVKLISYEEFVSQFTEEINRYSKKSEKYFKKEYKRFISCVKKHNEIINRLLKENKSYVDILNEDRIISLHNTYYFWWKNHYTVKYSDIKLTKEECDELLKLQEDDVEFYKQNFEVIYDYIKNDRFSTLSLLYNMRNSTVLRLFIEKFKTDPFLLPRYYQTGHYLNVYTEENCYRYMIFHMYERLKDYPSYINSEFANNFLHEVFDEEKSVLYEAHCENFSLYFDEYIKNSIKYKDHSMFSGWLTEDEKIYGKIKEYNNTDQSVFGKLYKFCLEFDIEHTFDYTGAFNKIFVDHGMDGEIVDLGDTADKNESDDEW